MLDYQTTDIKTNTLDKFNDTERKGIKNSNEEEIRKKDLGDWIKSHVECLEVKNISTEI